MLFEIYLFFVFLSVLSSYYIFKMSEIKYSHAKLIATVVVSVIPINIVIALVGVCLWILFNFYDQDGKHKRDFVAHMQKTNPD